MNERDLERVRQITAAHHVMCRAMWSSIYPMGHCAVACLTLAPALRASTEIPFRVKIGYLNNRKHAWLFAEPGLLVDPTYGQFKEGWSDEPWVVIDELNADEYDEWFVYETIARFDLGMEEHARNSILPKSSKDGWSARSNVKLIFEALLNRSDDAVSKT